MLAVVPTAFAGGDKKPKHPSGCVSAVCVYVEQAPSVTGPSATGSAGATGGSTQPLRVSKIVARKLAQFGGKDRALLETIVTNPNLGTNRLRTPSGWEHVAAPSVLGATFDVGSGPTVLFAALLATAVLLGVFSGARYWRRRG